MASLSSYGQHLLRKLPISSVCLLVTVMLGLLHIRGGDLSATYAADGNRSMMVTFLLSGIATLGTVARELRSSNIATTIPVLVIRYGILFIVGSRMTPTFLPIYEIVLWVLVVFSFLSVVVVPMLGRDSSNHSVHTRIVHVVLHTLRAWVLSGVLAIGLMLCTAAFQELLWSVADNTFPTILLLSFGVIGGFTRIVGLSRKSDERVSHKTVTIGIHLFGVIFGVILACMALILYIYFGRIYLQRDRPSNSVTVRWMLFMVWRIITMVLVRHELGNHTSRRRLQRRWFLLLVPIVCIVMMAVQQRIDQYGVTPKRYLVCAGIVRIVITIAAALFWNKRTLLISSVSLRGITLFSLIARPMDLQTFSYRSQFNRLTQVLRVQGLLQNGTLTLPVPQTVSADDRKALASSLEYLLKHHPTSLTQLDARLINEESTRALFGIDEEEARSYIWHERTSDYLEIPSVPLSVSGYSLAYPVMYGIAPGITVTQHNLSATLSGSILTLATSDYEETIDLTPLHPIVNKYYDDHIAPSPASFAFESQHFKVVVSDLQYSLKDEEVVIENMGIWVAGKE